MTTRVAAPVAAMITIMLAVLSVVVAAAAPTPTSAGHGVDPWYDDQYGDIWKWLIDPANAPYSTQQVRWRPCGDLTDLGISVDEGFLDWEHKFGYGVTVSATWNCSSFEALTVYGLSPALTQQICGAPTACFIPVGHYYDGNLGWWTISDAYIYVNAPSARERSQAEQKHWFAHEFGHSMALQHHSSCGSSVMTPMGCTDLVKTSDLGFPRCAYLYTC